MANGSVAQAVNRQGASSEGGHAPSPALAGTMRHLKGSYTPALIAELTIIRTSDTCISFRLHVRDTESLTATPRMVWSNRVVPSPEGDAGARRRLIAWARAHGYRVVERKEEQRKRA